VQHAVLHTSIADIFCTAGSTQGHILLDDRGYPRVGGLSFAKLENSLLQTGRSWDEIYHSPELQEFGEGGPPSDVYAFAITCFAIITGAEWKPATLQEERPDPTKIREAGAPPSRVDLIVKMWAEDPAARPPFEEVAALLEQERFWLSDVNAVEFWRYTEWLEREVSHDREDLRKEWMAHLEKAGSARDMANSIQGEPDVTQKFLKALGLVCQDQLASQVQARVRMSLTTFGSIKFEEVNRGSDVPIDEAAEMTEARSGP
jgi:hypothetical protein